MAKRGRKRKPLLNRMDGLGEELNILDPRITHIDEKHPFPLRGDTTVIHGVKFKITSSNSKEGYFMARKIKEG